MMKQIIRIIMEVIPVIIGILIALFINNWNEDRNNNNYLDQIFSTIEKELEESNLDIKETIPMQMASADTISFYLNDENVSLYDIMMKGNGINIPIIKTNSWKAIANTKIELVEYEKLSALADIQERKENLIIRTERQMDFIFQNFEKTDQKKKEVLRMMIWDIVGAEQELYLLIEGYLEK